MSQTLHLIGCCVCGKRWINVSTVAVACPWCESSCVDLGELPEAAIATLVVAGIPDVRHSKLM